MNYVLPRRTKCLIPCFLLLFFILCGIAIASQQISGKVVGVSDGDTITVLQNNRQFKVRIYGVDCPESSQAFGRNAKELTYRWSSGCRGHCPGCR